MRRRMLFIGLTVLVLTCLQAGRASAKPQNGWGLYGGLATHRLDGKLWDSTPLSYTSTGLSIGVDYQYALSPEFSLNPFLVSSSESTSGDTASGVTAGHGILGLEGRYWFENNMFIGVHLGSYSEVLSNDWSVSSGNGFGFGMTVGWESPTDGLFLMGQLDSCRISYSDANLDMTGVRLSIGYRWK